MEYLLKLRLTPPRFGFVSLFFFFGLMISVYWSLLGSFFLRHGLYIVLYVSYVQHSDSQFLKVIFHL